MCGIAGYVGDRESADVLVDALSKLEYRGYDSAGIAVFDHGNIKVKKCKGRLANLVEKMDEEGKPQGHVGIGHTMVLLRTTRSLRIFLSERDIALQVKQILKLQQSCLTTTMMAIR